MEEVSAGKGWHGHRTPPQGTLGERAGRAQGPRGCWPRRQAMRPTKTMLAPLGSALCGQDSTGALFRSGRGPSDLRTADGPGPASPRPRAPQLPTPSRQVGLGRTGKLWGHQHHGVEPDMMTLAKPLAGEPSARSALATLPAPAPNSLALNQCRTAPKGTASAADLPRPHAGFPPCVGPPAAGGLPIGAVLLREHVAAVMAPGDHGSTFAGNPLVCHAACAVFDIISDPGGCPAPAVPAVPAAPAAPCGPAACCPCCPRCLC